MHLEVLSCEPLAKPPLVSIVLTTYNGNKFVSDTYSMLKNQSIQNFECIVVDDGSKDDTVERYLAIAEKDRRFKVLSDKPRQNAGLAREYGVTRSKGDYIAILDQDDIWHPDKLLVQVKALTNHPHLDLCFTEHKNFLDGQEPKLETKIDSVILESQDHIAKHLCYGNFLACDSIMIRRSSEARIRGFKGHKLLKNREDYYSVLRYAYLGRIAKITHALTYCRYHSQKKSLSGSKRMAKADFILAQLLESEGLPGQLISALKAQGFKTEARTLLRIDPLQSIRLILRSFSFFPRPRTALLVVYALANALIRTLSFRLFSEHGRKALSDVEVKNGKNLRILSFNHHESYIRSLAKTGHTFDIVSSYKGLDLSWNLASGPIPENIRLVNFNLLVKKQARLGSYDLVICHTIRNLLWMFLYFKPSFIFIAHIPLYGQTPLERVKSAAKKFVLKLFELSHNCDFVAVSQFKSRTWGREGPAIVLTPQELTDGSKHSGESERGQNQTATIVTVGNEMIKRSRELGFPLLQQLMQKNRISIIGKNEGLTEALVPKNHNEFKKFFRSGDIYLYTVEQPFGDGYNTAMLEAMALGMPVITIANPSSPIQHGFNGLVGKNANELDTHLAKLKHDRDEIRRLGQNAKNTISKDFSRAQFVESWQKVISSACG